MKIDEMIHHARGQQNLTMNLDAVVGFMVPGERPKNGKKRLLGRKGPLGDVVAEYENEVLCMFKAQEVIDFLASLKVSGLDDRPSKPVK